MSIQAPFLLQLATMGARCLATILETNKVIEHLSLNNCDLRDEGLEPIANGNIWHRTLYIHVAVIRISSGMK